jgi:hypothetical protein
VRNSRAVRSAEAVPLFRACIGDEENNTIRRGHRFMVFVVHQRGRLKVPSERENQPAQYNNPGRLYRETQGRRCALGSLQKRIAATLITTQVRWRNAD